MNATNPTEIFTRHIGFFFLAVHRYATGTSVLNSCHYNEWRKWNLKGVVYVNQYLIIKKKCVRMHLISWIKYWLCTCIFLNSLCFERGEVFRYKSVWKSNPFAYKINVDWKFFSVKKRKWIFFFYFILRFFFSSLWFFSKSKKINK